MGGEASQTFQDMHSNEVWRCSKLMIMEGGGHEICESENSMESSLENSENSTSSKSSSDLVEDATSATSSSSSSSLSSNGPLYELSEIMTQLPIK